MKKTKYKVVVIYGYDDFPDYDIERKVEKLAKQFDGEQTGSGYGFGQRDLDYRFKTIPDSWNFYKKAKTLIPKLKYNEAYIYRNDEHIESPMQLVMSHLAGK